MEEKIIELLKTENRGFDITEIEDYLGIKDALGNGMSIQTPFNNSIHVFIGNTDFINSNNISIDFSKTNESVDGIKAETKDFVRTIFKIRLTKKHNELDFEICGNGFLYNMVRIIVGTLYEVGTGKRTAESICEILDAKDRTKM